MAKTTVIRTNKKFTMYKQVARRKGRGSKFQWNAAAQYIITYAGEPYKNKPSKVFKTFEEADKEWVYMILKH
jgi:hypothetical protein